MTGPRIFSALMAVPLSVAAAPAFAQDDLASERQAASPPEQIDILVPAPTDGGADPLAQKQCEDEQGGAEITGEIIVCRGLNRGTTDGLWNRQRWTDEYARDTAYVNDPQPPDVDNTHHPFAGSGVTIVLVGCFIPPCPGPHPLLIDIEALPPAPEGSDAERIAQGLAPRGEDGEGGERVEGYNEEELGLPPRPDWSEPED